MPQLRVLAFGGMNRVLPSSSLRVQTDQPSPARILQDLRPDKLPALEPRKSARDIAPVLVADPNFPRVKN